MPSYTCREEFHVSRKVTRVDQKIVGANQANKVRDHGNPIVAILSDHHPMKNKTINSEF